MRSKIATSMNYNMLFIITKVVGDIKPKSLSIIMMKQALKLLNVAGPLSRENACNVGAISWLLETVDVIQEDELLVSLVDIVCLLAKHGTKPYEIRHMLQLVKISTIIASLLI